jgi:hypothetical protein
MSYQKEASVIVEASSVSFIKGGWFCIHYDWPPLGLRYTQQSLPHHYRFITLDLSDRGRIKFNNKNQTMRRRKSMREHRYDSLTPIQRLYVAGKLKHFEVSVLAEDKSAMIDMLLSVELEPNQARGFSKEVLDNPRKFGYCIGGCLRS